MPKTSAQRTLTFNRQTSKGGFSLIEVMIVIGLVALMMSIVIPNFGMAVKINLNNSTRELATTIRTTHDESVLKGRVHRIAIDLDQNAYWVESGDPTYLMRSTEQAEEEKKRDERKSKEDREKARDPFGLASSVTKKKISLPRGVKFADVITMRSKEPQKSGTAYAYVFAHGFVEKLTIHLKDGMDREATLIVNSVTGKSRLFDRYVKDVE